MNAMIIPMKDALSSYRLAALRIQELRRMGVPCHIRENADPSGRRYLEVVSETPRQPRRKGNRP
jgi:hypothetical protein